MIATEEPILSRLDRLDTILRHLEENRGGLNRSGRSSYASSTHSSEIMGSGGHDASADTSPKSVDLHYRAIEDVITETQHKGTLLDRLDHVEDQVIQMESELDHEHKSVTGDATPTKKKGGLRQLVKSCIKSDKRKKSHKPIASSPLRAY